MSIKERKLNHDLREKYFGPVTRKPAEIFILGDTFESLLLLPRVGIVGSRVPTPYGKSVTEKLATELARAGVVIVSGLALGIDALAHSSAVSNNQPTIAVLPCGLDEIYPRTNRILAKQILEKGGALVSEYAHKTEPLRHNFIARNRLIAALSNVVVIPEAAEKSGSLHTAQFALDQGITVMAVPGPITSNLSRGTNNLIKTGATPVLSVDDILQELGLSSTKQQRLFASSKEEQIILELIANGITDSHELLRRSTLAADTFNQTMTMLEINDRIKPLGGNHWTLS